MSVDDRGRVRDFPRRPFVFGARYTCKMKTAIISSIIAIALIGCESSTVPELRNDHRTGTSGANVSRHFQEPDFEYLLQPDINNYKIDSFLFTLGYSPQLSGVYATLDIDNNNKPSSWVNIISLGRGSEMVSYKTSNREYFDLIKSQVDSKRYIQEIENQTAFYVKLIGPEFEFEFHRPKNGVNTRVNEYYEILCYRIKAKK